MLRLSPLRSSRVFFCLIFSLVLVLFLGTSCSKKEDKKSGTAGTAEVAKQLSESDFSKSLLTRVPENAIGFLTLQLGGDAYTKLSKSPWGSTTDINRIVSSMSSPDMEKWRALIQRVGLNPDDKEISKKVMNDAVVFLLPPTPSSVNVGVAFQSSDPNFFATMLPKVRAELNANGKTTEDVKLTQGAAFSVLGLADAGKKMFLGWQNDVFCMSTDSSVLEGLFTKKDNKLPAILSSASFSQASVGFPDSKKRYGMGYIDIERLIAESEKLGNAQGINELKQANLPLKALGMALAMDEVPQMNFRLIYDQVKGAENAWFKALGNSSSNQILAALPNKPLLFLSVDGSTIQRIKEQAASTMGEAAAAVRAQLAVLDGVKRLGIVLRQAAPGQSMLPVPDVMIVAESSDPAKTQTELSKLVTMAMQGSGAPAMPWSEKKIGEVAVKSMVTPFGVGAYLASSKNLVIAASTEAQMRQALGDSKGPGFSTGIPARVEEVFAKSESMGNLYVNFEEVASMMESMSGMMAMYAPQNQDANKLMQTENIQAIRKMGAVVGSVKVENGAIGISSFYQQAS